jgi:hypothetical protein
LKTIETLQTALKIARREIKWLKGENRALRKELEQARQIINKDHNYFQDKFNEISRANATPK